jgi:nucleoside-diphosphate-sugar epimerase
VPSLLVVGCGDLGGGVAALAIARGWRVWGVRRSGRGMPAGVEPIAADVTDPATLTPLAALRPDLALVALTPGGFSDEAYRRTYVDGLQNLLGALDHSTLRALLWVSSTGVYHQDDGSLVDEHSPTEPAGFSGRRLLAAEQLLRDSGLPHSCIRFGGIYGPGRDRLLRQLRDGRRTRAEPVRYSNRIHRDDCVGILDFLLLRAAAGDELDPVYVGVDTAPTPIHEVERWFADLLGLDYDALVQGDGELRGGNRRCSSARLQALGYRFHYPTYREGLPTLV